MTMEGAVVILDYSSDPTGTHPCIYSCLEADVTEPPKVKTIPADDKLIWSIEDFLSRVAFWRRRTTSQYQ
jgi:hypothetical protein